MIRIIKEVVFLTEDRISMRQLLVLLFVGLLSPAIRVLPGLTARAAGEAAWLSGLAALPVGLLLCWGLFRVLRALPEGEGLAAGLERLLGRLPGKALTAVYLLWGLLLLSANARLCAQRFLATGYRNTELPLFVLVLLAAVLWMARGRFSAFARAGEVFYLILSITLAAVLLFALFNVEPENVLPVWVEDAPGVAAATLPVLSIRGYAVYGAFLAGAVRRREGDRPRAMRWTAAFCLVLTALQFINLGNFGPVLVARMEFPFFMMVKGIGVQGAFQRVESVVVALWVLSDLVFLGVLAFACCAMAKSLFGLKREGRAAAPVVLAGIAGALFLFPDAFTLRWFSERALAAGNLALGFAVPAVLVLVTLIRGRGKSW